MSKPTITMYVAAAVVACGMTAAVAACGLGLPSAKEVQSELHPNAEQPAAPDTQGSAPNAPLPGPGTAPSKPAAAGGPVLPMPATEAPLLKVQGTHIVTSTGSVWAGRGFSVHDTRNCEACTSQKPNLAEFTRRVDTAVDTWHANFIRILLESYPDDANGIRVQYKSLLDDPAYFNDVINLVRHVGTKPNTYVLLSPWVDPSYDKFNVPTQKTSELWTKLATALAHDTHVIFAASNEPHDADDATVWQGINTTVQAIRDAEDKAGGVRHVVSVQATQDWARYLDYYLTHPITAGGGENIVYETHVYNHQDLFDRMVRNPAKTLPLIIGEFGIVNDPSIGVYMDESDVTVLMDTAEQLQIPFTAWTFHQKCGKNSLLAESADAHDCGINMPLNPSTWGQVVINRLKTPPKR